MTYFAIFIGCVLILTLLTPGVVRALAHASNRRLARKLAKGPVGLLLKFDYNYAIDLSKMVSKGDLSLSDATSIAEHCLKDKTAERQVEES